MNALGEKKLQYDVDDIVSIIAENIVLKEQLENAKKLIVDLSVKNTEYDECNLFLRFCSVSKTCQNYLQIDAFSYCGY